MSARPSASTGSPVIGIRDRFAIDIADGADMKAHGNVFDHEYEIERDGDTVATISKKWFRVRDSYGVDIAAGEDTPLILAITVAIDSDDPRLNRWTADRLAGFLLPGRESTLLRRQQRRVTDACD
jgi:hypothetical protein